MANKTRKKKGMSPIKKRDQELRKYRAQGTVFRLIAVFKSFQVGTEIDTVISKIPIFINDDFNKWVGFEIEKIIYWAYDLGIEESDVRDNLKYASDLHKMLQNLSFEIKKQKKFREAQYLISYMDGINAYKDKLSNVAQTLYHDILMQALTYLYDVEDIIIGFRNDGRPITTKSIIPLIDYHMSLFPDQAKLAFTYGQGDSLVKSLNKIGNYNLTTYHDIDKILKIENLINVSLILSAPYITEQTKHLVDRPWYTHKTIIDISHILEMGLHKEELFEDCTEIHNLFPEVGVMYNVQFGSIYGVELHETQYNGDIIVLYRLNTRDGGISGFVNITRQIGSSPWKGAQFVNDNGTSIESTVDVLENTHNVIVSMVLYLYLYFVKMDFEMPLWIMDKIESASFFEYKQSKKNKASDKRLYKHSDCKHKLKHFKHRMRRLPAGFKASPDAHAKARKKGRIIPEGYTYVSDFDKMIPFKIK